MYGKWSEWYRKIGFWRYGNGDNLIEVLCELLKADLGFSRVFFFSLAKLNIQSHSITLE